MWCGMGYEFGYMFKYMCGEVGACIGWIHNCLHGASVEVTGQSLVLILRHCLPLV